LPKNFPCYRQGATLCGKCGLFYALAGSVLYSETCTNLLSRKLSVLACQTI
jgi:hypothetical protein